MPALLAILMKQLKQTTEKNKSNLKVSLSDCLMSELSLFSLKYSFLLKFDNNRSDDIIKHNLHSLFRIKYIPCDTYLRERLDAKSR